MYRYDAGKAKAARGEETTTTTAAAAAEPSSSVAIIEDSRALQPTTDASANGAASVDILGRQLSLPRIKTKLAPEDEEKEKETTTTSDAIVEKTTGSFNGGLTAGGDRYDRTTTPVVSPLFAAPGQSTPPSRQSSADAHSAREWGGAGGGSDRDGGGGGDADAEESGSLWRGSGDSRNSRNSRRSQRTRGVHRSSRLERAISASGVSAQDPVWHDNPPVHVSSSSAAGSARSLGSARSRDRAGLGEDSPNKTVAGLGDTPRTVLRSGELHVPLAQFAATAQLAALRASAASSNDDDDVRTTYEEVDEAAWKEVEELQYDDSHSDDDEWKEAEGVGGAVEREGEEEEEAAAAATEAATSASGGSHLDPLHPSRIDLAKLSPAQRFAVTQVLKGMGVLPPDISAADDDNNSEDITIAEPGGKGGLAKAKWRAAVAAKSRAANGAAAGREG
jgi:hypothetical protein